MSEKVLCPICGSPMRKQGRGATTRKHGPRWVCPLAESEVYKDADGHLHRYGWAEHRETRVWSKDDPDITAQFIPDRESVKRIKEAA